MLMIYKNVKGKQYKQLIDLLSRNCNRFAFVEDRRMMEIEEERLAYIDDMISDIKWHLIERRIQKEWETTRLAKDSAYVFYFQMNNATTQFLKERSHSLFGWIGELPEDLMFYHNDKCILAVCSHEEYFFVDETIWDTFLLK
ncbi:stage III sporulation protein AH [Metabacillus litoralis]|uniref:Stage III sporulation protein AH n=1 Tax=Metabacillus litoralis TaxID=152268 RepID=A0A5C6W5X7_9BACI|nr:stage III sporulation protein AH [Metabacillus litoralis]TXC92743.1 stage III sporulation protein AH [Metabacillus litoralis]